MKHSTVVAFLSGFVLGTFSGVALVEWLTSVAAAIGTAIVAVVIALGAYYLLRRRSRSKREQPGRADEPPAVP